MQLKRGGDGWFRETVRKHREYPSTGAEVFRTLWESNRSPPALPIQPLAPVFISSFHVVQSSQVVKIDVIASSGATSSTYHATVQYHAYRASTMPTVPFTVPTMQFGTVGHGRARIFTCAPFTVLFRQPFGSIAPSWPRPLFTVT